MAAKLWTRFKKNRLASAGLIFIVATAFLAVFAAVIAPDKSEQANDIKLQLAAQSPGFSINAFILPEEPIHQSLFKTFFFGREPSSWYPVTGFQLDHSQKQIVLSEYSGDEESGSFETRIPYESVPAIEGMDSVTVLNHIKEHLTETRTYWLGTDRFGRDLLSRLMLGARVSLSVGFISVFISLFIGTILGCFAGYFRGTTDAIIMWLINVVWSLPTLLLVIAFSMAIGKGYWQIFIAVGLSMWVDVARIVRGQVLSLREKEFVEAAQVLGLSDMRIIFRHILPNITGPLTVIAAANFASAILLEAGLSFLGLGVQPPSPSWGMMIKEHFGYIVLDSAYLAIVPGMAIMLLVMSFNFVGNGIRDALDVKMK